MIKRGIVLIFALVVLFFLIYPTAFDKRPDVFAQTKWGADVLGLLFGYASLWVGTSLALKSGGQLRTGLWWFNVGMFIMGSSFWFGPIINHYKLINPDLVEGMHGLAMLGGMLGYLMAMVKLPEIGGSHMLSVPKVVIYIIAFLGLMALYYPTMSVMRTPGNALKYWAELAGFGTSGVMAAMAFFTFKSIGGRFRHALNWLLFSSTIMALSYPFGPISQPNHYWTGAQGGTMHHGIMAVSILFFLGTVILLRRLEVYSVTDT